VGVGGIIGAIVNDVSKLWEITPGFTFFFYLQSAPLQQIQKADVTESTILSQVPRMRASHPGDPSVQH
jgi:hypothetical protein